MSKKRRKGKPGVRNENAIGHPESTEKDSLNLPQTVLPKWAPVVLILICGISPYLISLDYPMVFDTRIRLETDAIHQLWPAKWLTEHQRPVPYFTFTLNYLLHADSTAGYRLFNAVLHAFNGLLVYALLSNLPQILSGNRQSNQSSSIDWFALTVALVWVVHPVHSQAVTYIIQRMESLMAFFYLGTLLCLQLATKTKQPAWLVISVISSGLAMATKEVSVTLPVAAIWFDRVFLAQSWTELFRKRKFYYMALAATWGILAAAMSLLAKNYGGSVGQVEGLTPWEYLLNQSASILHYCQLLLIPYPLCLDYGWQPALPQVLYAKSVLVLALLSCTLIAMFRRPNLGFFLGMYFLVLAPTSSIVPIIDLVFEHRVYLPNVFLITALGILLQPFIAQLEWKKYLIAGLVVFLMILTTLRNLDYSSAEQIWRSCLEVSPHNARALHNVMIELEKDGRFDEAIELAQSCIERSNSSKKPHGELLIELGDCLQRNGRVKEAIPVLEQGIEQLESTPRMLNRSKAIGGAWISLGVARWSNQNPSAALECLKKGIEKAPEEAVAYGVLGQIYASQSQSDLAIKSWDEAIRLRPDWPDVHRDLSLIYARQGNREKAEYHLNEIRKIQPEILDGVSNQQILDQLSQ